MNYKGNKIENWDYEDFYENKQINSDLVTVNFTDLSNEEFHQYLLEANNRLLTNYCKKKQNSPIEQANKLYLDKDSNFWRFRQT